MKHFKIIEEDFNGYSNYRIKQRFSFFFWKYLTQGYYSPLESEVYISFSTEDEAYNYLKNHHFGEGYIHTPRGIKCI